jgi:hypothetical protein
MRTNFAMAFILLVGLVGFTYTAIAWYNTDEAKIGECFLQYAAEDASIDAEAMQDCMASEHVMAKFIKSGAWNK